MRPFLRYSRSCFQSTINRTGSTANRFFCSVKKNSQYGKCAGVELGSCTCPERDHVCCVSYKRCILRIGAAVAHSTYQTQILAVCSAGACIGQVVNNSCFVAVGDIFFRKSSGLLELNIVKIELLIAVNRECDIAHCNLFKCFDHEFRISPLVADSYTISSVISLQCGFTERCRKLCGVAVSINIIRS